MRHCQFCGAELSERERFCHKCGSLVPLLPDTPPDVGASPAVEVQSQDTPTFISNPSLPTAPSERSQQDAPTSISDAMPTLRREESKQQEEATWWAWSADQTVQKRHLPGDRQTEENPALPLLPDPLLFGPTLAGSAGEHVPMVQGTPQIGEIPSVQGTPSMLNSPPAAHGLVHGGAPAVPSSGPPPSASPAPEPLWSAQRPPPHAVSQVAPHTGTVAPGRPAQGKKGTPKFDKAIEKIVASLLALSRVKNAKILLLVGAILVVLVGSGTLSALDEAFERGDATGFLGGFDEGIERQLSESVIHGHAHAIATAYAVAATGTAAALQHPYPQGGNLVYSDSMSKDNKAYPWVYGYEKILGRDCFFANGGYHVVETHSNDFFYCIASNTNFSDFAFQAEMTFIQGNYGGILFRSAGTRHYIFRIGRDGSYILRLYVDDTGRTSRLLAYGYSTVIQTGLDQANLLTVVARGNNIDLYVNQHYLTSVQDSGYSQGQIGLEAEDHGVTSEVMFSNVEVRAL